MKRTNSAIWTAVLCAVTLTTGRATAAPVTGIVNGSFEDTGVIYLDGWEGDALREAKGWVNASPTYLYQAASAPSGGMGIFPTHGNRWLHLAYDTAAYPGVIHQYLGTMVVGTTYTFAADVLDSPLAGLGPYAAYAAFRDDAWGVLNAETVTLDGVPGAFNISYTAQPADDGRDLYIHLQGVSSANPFGDFGRGGVDNARLVNVIPDVPTGPSPADSAVDVPVATTLSWSATPGAMGYRVSLWPVGGATNTADVLVPTWSPGALQKSTTYGWRVVATNAYGSATGAVWTFATPVPVPITNVLNGSFESTEGPSLIPGAPAYDIVKAVSWDLLTVGDPSVAGSTTTTGPYGNYDAIAAGNVTGSRHMRLNSIVGVHQGAIAQNLGAMEEGKTYTLRADVFGGNGSAPAYGGGGMFLGVWRASLQSDVGGSPTVYATATSGNLTQGAFAPDGLLVSYTATASDAGNDLWIKYWVPAVTEVFAGGIDNVRLSFTKPPVISGVLNGSFEDITGTDNKLPTLEIYNAAGWVELTVGVPWEVGSTTTTGPVGNYEGIDAGSVTGARYMRVATDDTANYGLIAQFLGSMEEGKTYTLTADVLGGAGTIAGDWQASLQSDIVGSPTVYASASSGPVGTGAFSPDGLIVSYTATALDAGNPLWIQYTIPPVGAVAFRGGIDNVRLAMSSPEPPPEPTAPSPTNGAVNAAATGGLTWSSSGATGYQVSLWPVGGSTNTFEGSGSTLSPGALRIATEYQWQVLGTNAYGSATGAVWTFTTGLYNGSFEETGSTLVAYPTDGLKEAVGWINLSGAGFAYQASSMDLGGMALESWPATPTAGSRVLRLVSDQSDVLPLQIGRIAQNLGTMVAGETYTFIADALGGASTPPYTWGATAKFVNEAAEVPGTVYAEQTVGGMAQGVTSVDAFTLSYTALPADDGNPLVILLVAAGTPSLVANRGGIDNARLSLEPPPPPAVPTGPSPVDGEVHVAASGSLTWSAPGAVGYQVSLWPVGGPTTTVEAAIASLNPGVLRAVTEYQWQVLATNAYGSATGAVWTFTTGLHNASFEDTGIVYLTPWEGDALREATGWVNLSLSTGPDLRYQAASAPSGGQGIFPTDGIRWLHLAYDAGSLGYQGKIAQNLGTMEAGKTYTFKADLFSRSFDTAGGVFPSGMGSYFAYAAFQADSIGGPTLAGTVDSVAGATALELAGKVKTDVFNLSYKALPGDDGRALYIYLEGAPGNPIGDFGRGGIDNARLEGRIATETIFLFQ